MEVRQSENVNNKYRVPIKVNGFTLMSHIDLGSDCTLIRLSDAVKINVKWDTVDLPVLKGLGNVPYNPIGSAYVTVDIQGVVENNVKALVVADNMINHPILIGHTYTERPSIEIVKTSNDLIVKRAHNICSSKRLALVASKSTIIRPGTMIPVDVHVDSDYSGMIYVNGTIRGSPETISYLLPGEYQLESGKGAVLIQNLSSKDLDISQNALITRVLTIDKDNKIMSVLNITLDDEADFKFGNLTDVQETELRTLITRYSHCFSSSLSDLGFTTSAEMVIKLKDFEPVVYRPYRLSYADRQLVRNMIQEMLDYNIVRESNSPYASPIVLVQKKTGEKRLCVDYSIKEHYPLPRIEDQLDVLAGNKLFTTLDLASGYYQIPIAEQSKDKTAFVTPDGQFEYNRMPFGLVNAPSVFQRTINKILNDARVKYALVFMDDILIPSKSFEEGLARLEEVLELLKKGGLTLKLSKCRFFFDKLDYLGFEISAEGIRPGSLKTDAVSKFPTPQNQHDVRRFIGLASFFRRFIKGFALIAQPLTLLLKKDFQFCWTGEQEKAFQTLKAKLVDRPVLALYNPHAETQLHTDASKLGLAGILLQKNELAVLQPIAYFSRQTTDD